MKKELFDTFMASFNVGSWHPCDAKRFYTYVDYCCLNKIDEEDAIELILDSQLPQNVKEGLVQKLITIYDYLHINEW